MNGSSSQNGNAVVIGAGLGGLAAAARLRKRGYSVTLIEKLDQLGGRATVVKRNGFAFDMGPTVVTAHWLFDELFQLFGKKREDYVSFVPLYPWYRIQFHDGATFDYGGTLEQTLDQIRKFDPDDADGYLRLLRHAQAIFDVGFTQLGDQPFHSLWSMAKAAPHMVRLGAWRTVWGMACKYLHNDRLRRIFSFQPLLVGGNPFNTTSIYSLIHYLEREWGVLFAMGGTGAIVAAMERLLREEGVTIRTRAEAEEILVRDGAVHGVRLCSGEVLDAGTVVCNADAPWAYHRLLPAEHRRKWTDRRLSRLKYSMGLFVLYFGTTRQYPDVHHHTIMLGQKYGELLHDMFDLKRLEMSDFSIYLHRPTRTDPSMAPPGCDSFYALCPVPNLQGDTDWAQMGASYRNRIVDHLQRHILPDLKQHIVEDFFVTPLNFRDDLNTLHGTGFSIQPTFGQSAYFRFHNRSEEVRGLYLVGSGTHPGAGMPGVLCSAKVLERILPP